MHGAIRQYYDCRVIWNRLAYVYINFPKGDDLNAIDGKERKEVVLEGF